MNGSSEWQHDAPDARLVGLSMAQVMTRSFPGEIRYWSHGMERLYGFSQAEAVGRISHQLLRTEFPGSLADLEHELLERSEWSGELRHRRRDGQEIVVASHQSLLRDHVGAPLLVTEVNNDITREERAREASRHLAALVESSRDASARRCRASSRPGTARRRRCSATAPRR
jgi:PAS domain S-box-containing protein